MASVMKHVGAFGSKPCVVLFREVPGEPENCLIVETGSLSDVKHDDLMNVVQSLEAQEAKEISEVLNRRQFTDGSNMLNDLHFSKKIQKVPTEMVFLTPTTSTRIPLREVNAEINKLEGGYVAPKTEQDPNSLSTPRVDQVNVGEKSENTSDADVAQNLLTQALLMEEDAKNLMHEAEVKKASAYKIDPSLRPPGRPKKISE